MEGVGVPEPAAGTPVPGGPPAAHVLLVEDEQALLRALRINLHVRGYGIATAGSGRAALTEARRRPPAAINLDLGLPDLDGVSVLRGLREWTRAPTTT